MNREPRVGRATAGLVTAVLVAFCLHAALAPKASSTVAVSHAVSLNSASAAELELLPRVGPALAARIVLDRQQNGPFATVADLDRVRGIGPAMLEQLSPFVVP